MGGLPHALTHKEIVHKDLAGSELRFSFFKRKDTGFLFLFLRLSNAPTGL